MIMPAIQSDLLPHILERANIILRMNAQELKLDFLHTFSIPELTACCDRITAHLPNFSFTDVGLQKELIQNESFAAYLAKLLPLLPEERDEDSERRVLLMQRLCALVKVCQEDERDITVYPETALMEALSLDIRDTAMLLVFLDYFSPMKLEDTSKQTVMNGLNCCVKVPLELSGEQQELLLEPFVSSRHLFVSDPFPAICSFLNAHPGLKDILRLLHQRQIHELLELAEYRVIAQDTPGCFKRLESITGQMDRDAVEQFLAFWKKGGCALAELRSLERWITTHPGQDWDNLFATYSGYINLLYGVRFKEIDLSGVSAIQEDILIYAIIHNKKHFIRLVDEHTETFFSLPSNSVLFLEELYKEHLNLNELTERDLCECARMRQRRFLTKHLTPGRRYTFPELKALYDAPEAYVLFYHALTSDSQDYRLKILQQLRKRNLLSANLEQQDLALLARYLDQKPLHDWLQEDFGHIRNLTAQDAVDLLIHLDRLQHLIFSMMERTDVLLALKNLDALAQFDSIDDLKREIIQVDSDWRSLAAAMKLSGEFQELYQSNIMAFICNNGAHIAEAYRQSLDSVQHDGFLRVVKAELMGQLRELKYFEGDLQRELDFSLPHQAETSWKRNLHMERNGVQTGEYDDFFSTMLLGVRPYPTCLAYDSGAYRECLLSSFDSNKKILYAAREGKTVGRAFLRLTKGRLTGADQSGSQFAFVDLVNVTSSREGTSFMQTRFDIYISKSKAGMQYLDSLDGQATASSEGSYKADTFLVQEPPGR